MDTSFICRHLEVDWIDSHTCQCSECRRFGHFFEDGFAVWNRARTRPAELEQAGIATLGAGGPLVVKPPQRKAG